MTAKRIDKNQPEIVEALRKAGASVQPLHTVGKGCPDLVVGYRQACYLLEVKGENGELTDDQVTWHAKWRGHVQVVRTEEEALRAIGAVQ